MESLSFGNPVGLWTLTKRELVRTVKIINQTIWPPIITTLLYVFVFGLALGSRIKTVQGVSYAEFLIPGLIMLQVIDGTYAETSSSVFQGRFMSSIQELLISPLSAAEIVSGYVVAAILRAYLIANLILLVGALFVHTIPSNWPLYFGVTRNTAVQFLPPAFRAASFANPMFYMIDAFRYSFTGRGDVPLGLSLGIVSGLAVLSLGTALAMVARGHKLRV